MTRKSKSRNKKRLYKKKSFRFDQTVDIENILNNIQLRMNYTDQELEDILLERYGYIRNQNNGYEILSGFQTENNFIIHSLDDEPARLVQPNRQEWYKFNKKHRDNDKPAVISNGFMEWYQDGLLHREADQPAVIFMNGTQEWYQHGKLDRNNDQPAIITNDGDQEWWRKNLRHRDDDKPAVIKANGDREWWINGVNQRLGDKPALVYSNGMKVWKKNRIIHRDGPKPAIIRANGEREYWKNGRFVPEEDILQPNIFMSPEDQNFLSNQRDILNVHSNRDVVVMIENFYRTKNMKKANELFSIFVQLYNYSLQREFISCRQRYGEDLNSFKSCVSNIYDKYLD